MVKTYSISDCIVIALENHAKDNHVTYSKVVENALLYYLSSSIATQGVQRGKLEVAPRGQSNIYDFELKP